MSAYEGADRACPDWGRPPQAHGPHRRLGVGLATGFAVLGTVFLVSLSPILASQGSSSLASVSSLATGTEAGPQNISTSGYAVPSNLSYCGLLGPNPGTAPNLPGYTANVTLLWNDLCAQQVFMSWIDAWGGPFYLAYPDYGANLSYWAAQNLSTGNSGSSQGLYANFQLLWEPSYCYNNSAYRFSLPPCSWEEFWRGDVWTNVLSGPFFLNSSCDCGSKEPPPPPPPSPGFPYGPVLGFSLAGAFAVGVHALSDKPGRR